MTDKFKLLDLFSGIGGFSLGFEATGGFETVGFCEIEEFPQKILNKHWPEVPIFKDVRELNCDRLIQRGIKKIDALTGGFPCQDISLAGAQAGIRKGTRGGLWSECLRLLGELRPKIAVFENVTNLLSGPSEQQGGWFSQILCDLAQIGYDAEWHSLPASFIGAWHKRDRVWLLAYPKKVRMEGRAKTPILRQRHLQIEFKRGFEVWPGRSNLPAPIFSRTHNGVQDRVDRTKSLGNAIVPAIAEIIAYAILEFWQSCQITPARKETRCQKPQNR